MRHNRNMTAPGQESGTEISMRSKLIVNPIAGSDAAPDFLRVINERLRRAVGDLDIVMTVEAGDAEGLAASSARDGYDRLYVAGGDGTLNEVINGVAGVDGALARITFGLIPLGTGNDFARALGLPEGVDGALDVLLDGRTVEVDVGVMNDRYFINVSAGGFIAEVSDSVDPQLKSFAGKLAYLIGGAQVLMDYEPVGLRVRTPDWPETVVRGMTMQMFAVCNSRLVGGGRLIAPHAIIDDGMLDVCLVETMSTVEFLGLLARVSGGDHIDDPRVIYFRTRELDFQFDHPIKVNTDGEVLETDSCRYRVLPRGARFIAGDVPFAKQKRA
jgi:diacylglycerol kinase (ATP)